MIIVSPVVTPEKVSVPRLKQKYKRQDEQTDREGEREKKKGK